MTKASATCILLVEDDPLLRQAFRMLLEDAGYDVSEAGSARQALAAVEENVPDLVLLDLGLPDRSGLDLARELRRRPHAGRIKVVALTGRVGPRQRQECLEAGCAGYFSKPVDPQELLRQLPILLDRAAPA